MSRSSFQIEFGLTGHMTEISSCNCGNMRPTERRLRARVPSQQNTITFQYASFWKEHEVMAYKLYKHQNWGIPVLGLSNYPLKSHCVFLSLVLPLFLTSRLSLCKCCTMLINKLHSKKVKLAFKKLSQLGTLITMSENATSCQKGRLQNSQ